MRNILRNAFLNLVGQFSRPSNCVHILNGHYVNLVASANDADILASLFLKLSRNYKFIDFEEACYNITSGKKVHHPYLAFSFDDGFKECYASIRPILNNHKVSGAFFINPSVIEAPDNVRADFLKDKLKININKEFMTWEEIRQLHSEGHVIGNHTMNHTALVGLEYNEAYQEVYSGKMILENYLKYNCKYFAFPYGRSIHIDSAGIDAVLKCHQLAFTGCEYTKYFYQSNKQILSRRHFEGNWPKTHMAYFLSKHRS